MANFPFRLVNILPFKSMIWILFLLTASRYLPHGEYFNEIGSFPIATSFFKLGTFLLASRIRISPSKL
ncbi:MAG: hypothetical protein J7K59_02110 [Candidatus Korarchaeota archaeon]|nr:hypothetical protein [Candidatus Korarchaeota archaeon]